MTPDVQARRPVADASRCLPPREAEFACPADPSEPSANFNLSELLDWQAVPFYKQLAVGVLFLTAFLASDGSSTAAQAWEGSPPWYLPVGLSLVLLLCGGMRYSPLVLVASILAAVVNYHWSLFSPGGIPGAIAIYLGYVGGACILRRRWPGALRFETLRDVGKYLAISLTAAIWSALAGMLTLLGGGRIHRSDILWTTAQWWASDALALVSFTPFVLVYIAPRVGCWLQSKKGSSFLPEGASHLSAGEIIELTAQFLSAGLAIWLIFGYAPAIPYQPLYLLFVPVIWVSVRRGLPGAVLMTFAISVGMTLAAWITQAHKGSLPRLQLALLALGLTGLCLGALVTEQGRVQRVIRESERRYRLLFERNLAGVFRTTLTGRVLECNQATANIFGYASPTEVMALPAETFYEEKSDREKLLTRIRSERSITNHEVKFRRKNGDSVWTMLNMSLVADEPGSGEFLEATMVDITQRKLAEERVRSLAYYDALTGLANRTLLLDRLSKALASARRQKRKVALLFLDLDRFKVINDSLGHSVGDLLLKEVAARLKRVTRDPDTAARLGGDEFLILLTDVEDISGVAVAAKRFMDAISAGYSIQSHYLNVSCSLGISIFPEHGADNDTLIKHADAAMYTAKESGRNDFRFFTADMNTQAVARLALENGLRSALANNELFLVYQPQMDMRTGKTNGLEALLRWQHPDIGLVSPNDFIRIAENSGLIITIGEWVLKSACSQARKWQDEGLPPVSIAVNVSAVQFRQENFPQTIEKVLREAGLDPKYLELELTESLLLSNADVMFSVLQQLTVMGVRLAIDDFGTGYSSLSYLKRFPVSKLKIDGSFIRDVALHQDDAAITIAIISMAKSLKLKVVAEGVENEAQLSFLRGQGCDGIQGYHFSKPLELCKVEDKLRTEYPDAKMTPQSTEACEPHQGAGAS